MAEEGINDDGYRDMQAVVQLTASILANFDVELLDGFIARARQAQDLGPILHPSEFRAGAEKLAEILAHAEAIRFARSEIIRAMP